jgi:hypothetical protein
MRRWVLRSPAGDRADDWSSDVYARCPDSDHDAPDPDCSCGVYCFAELGDVWAQAPAVGLVEPAGKVIRFTSELGDEMRCESLTLRKLWVHRSKMAAAVSLRETLHPTKVQLFNSIRELARFGVSAR